MLTSVFTNKERDCNRSPFLVFSTTIICGFFASCLRNKNLCNPRIFGGFAYSPNTYGDGSGTVKHITILLRSPENTRFNIIF